MNFTVRVRPAAKADIRAARLWYEQQRVGLGKDFVECIDEAVLGLRTTPRRHQVVWEDIRRAVLRRFPYCLYYRVHEKTVEVIGVFHARRDPTAWQTRADS